MGRINVEGLGVVEIAGDEPTAEEISIITDNFKTMAKSKKFIPMKDLGKSHTKEHLNRFFPFLSEEFRKIDLDRTTINQISQRN